MGKKKRVKSAAAQLDVVKGSGKKYEKKENGGKAGKICGIIAGILAVLLIAGVFAVYYVPGIVQKNMTAAESDNNKITSPMLAFFFNNTYRNFVSQYSSYLQYTGLDVTKDLRDQTTTEGQTWFDYFMSQTQATVKRYMVLSEAAKTDDKFDMDKEIAQEVDETIASMKEEAAKNNVSFEYYLKALYGTGLNEKTVRKCMVLSETATHYAQELAARCSFTEDDWNKYYEENKDTFRKVDFLSYTFSVTATAVKDDATDDEKAEAAAKDQAEAERLHTLADGLAATASKEEFSAYVENYLRNDKYAGMDEAALEEQKVDIDSLVSGCLKTGTTYSESDVNKWLFDDARKGYETYTESKDTSFTVYMILPAEGSDIGSACLYRDTYALKNFRYIPALISELKTDDAAKTYAENVMKEYEDNATEDGFAKLAAADKYGDGTYEGGLVENGDKGLLCDEVDEWLNDSARKAGDCEMIHNAEKGYYVVYYVGDGQLKWQSTANENLVSNACEDEYKTFEEKYKVSDFNTKAVQLIKEVDMSYVAETTAAN